MTTSRPSTYSRGWGAPNLQWLGTSTTEWLNNLAMLLFSNPVFSPRTALRPLGLQARNIRRWIADESRVFVEQNLAGSRNNEEFQILLENFITGLLAKCHYRHEVLSSAAMPGNVLSGQFWFTASYFVCGWVDTPEPQYLRMWFLGHPFFDEEFYGSGRGSVHPSIVIINEGKCCRMVPFSTKRRGKNLKTEVQFANGSSSINYAICRFRFRGYERTLGQKDLEGRSISPEQFQKIKEELTKWT